MGTSNFHNVNASKVFAVELETEFDYDDLVSNLKSELQPDTPYFNQPDPDELRSYPSNTLGVMFKDRIVDGYDLRVSIYPVVRSGYYAGCNLDWFYTIQFANNCNTYDNYKMFAEHVKDDEFNFDLSVNEKSNILTVTQLELGKLKKQVEDVYAKFSTPLVVKARFSNGETMYEASK